MTPSERTLAFYRDAGWTVIRVEQTIMHKDHEAAPVDLGEAARLFANQPIGPRLTELLNNYAAAILRANRMIQFRRDFAGFADYIAFNGHVIVAIQSTTMDNRTKHMAKIEAEPRAALWIRSNSAIHLICWREIAGKQKAHLTCYETVNTDGSITGVEANGWLTAILGRAT